MTRNGCAYRLPPPELPNDESASGASQLWPTLDASGANDGEDLDNWLARRERVAATGINGNGMGTPLAVAVRLWPTLTARDERMGSAADSPRMKRKAQEGYPPDLNDAAAPGQRLNPAWCEPFMGWPMGYLTGLPPEVLGPSPRGSRKKGGSPPEPQQDFPEGEP